MRRAMYTDPHKFTPLLEVPTHKKKIALVFIHDEIEIQNVISKILQRRGGIPAKLGLIASNDVIIPRGPNRLAPTDSALLQALNISSRMSNGQVEILRDVTLLKSGDKVGSREVSLLNKLQMKPFSSGLIITHYFVDGFLCDYEPFHRCCMHERIDHKLMKGINNVAALSLSIGFPTLASLPHVLFNAYKQVLSIAIETNYSFPAAEPIKSFIANPPPILPPPPKERNWNELSDAEIIRILHEGASSEDDGSIGLFD